MGTPFVPTQPQGMAITNDEIARRRAMNPLAYGTPPGPMNPFAMGAQAPAQTPLAPTGQTTDAMGRPTGATPPFVAPQQPQQPRAVQNVPAGTPISPPSGMAPVQAPSLQEAGVPPTDAGQATALQGLAPMGDPMANVQHTPGHAENAAAIQQRMAARGAEPTNANDVPGAHHGFRKFLDVLGGIGMGVATFNPMAGIGTYKMLHNAPLNRAQASWQAQDASDKEQFKNERELGNLDVSQERMESLDTFHKAKEADLEADNKRAAQKAEDTPIAGTDMQDPTSPTGYSIKYGDGKMRPWDPKKGDPYKDMDTKHWENVLADPQSKPEDKARAKEFLKHEADQKKAGRSVTNIGDGMSAGEKRDLDASTRNIAKQRDDKKAELHAMMANPIFDENDPKIGQLRKEIADLDQEYETAYEAHSHHGGAKAGGSKQPAQSPQTHVFSKAAWLKNNPQGDVNTVAAQAKQSGYEVTD